MEVLGGLDSLKSLLGVPATRTAAQPSAGKDSNATGGSLQGDRATFSQAGSEIAHGALASEIRSEKVESVRASLAAGTYSIPASAVASKVVDSMFAGGASQT